MLPSTSGLGRKTFNLVSRKALAGSNPVGSNRISYSRYIAYGKRAEISHPIQDNLHSHRELLCGSSQHNEPGRRLLGLWEALEKLDPEARKREPCSRDSGVLRD